MFLWIVLGICALLFGLFIAGWINSILASVMRNYKLEKLISPAIEAVQGNLPSAKDLVMEFAEIPVTRNHLFSRLTEMGRADLFPALDREIDKIAESELACWLMHKNELGSAPAAIEFVRAMPISEPGRSGKIFLFRFRAPSLHWAEDRGWMAGIVGPYWDNAESVDSSSWAFSELTPFDQLTEDQHVDFLLKALKTPILVVRS